MYNRALMIKSYVLQKYKGLVDVGVELALGGMIRFVNTFAGLMLRAVEQIRTCVAYAKTNVKIIGGYTGISDYKDGATHYSITDLDIMRAIPNMVVMVLADAIEAKKWCHLCLNKMDLFICVLVELKYHSCLMMTIRWKLGRE